MKKYNNSIIEVANSPQEKELNQSTQPINFSIAFLTRLLKKLASNLQPLWVWGLIILFLFVGKHFTPVTGEGYEWFQYLSLGTIFPVVLLVFTLVPRYRPAFAKLFKLVESAIVIISIPIGLAFLIERDNFIFLLVLAAVQLAITLSPVTVNWRENSLADKLSWNIVRYLVVTLAWIASVSLVSWVSFDKWVFGSFYIIAICLLALLVVLFGFYFTSKNKLSFAQNNPLVMLYRRPGAVGNILVLFFFIFASLRVDRLFDNNSLHHWSVFVGPAEMVRQGGWLLWDVPSQYGFLNELLIALLGIGSTWESFYLLNALTLLLSAIFLFFVLRNGRSDLPNFLFAATVTYAAVYLIPGWVPGLFGPQITPSEGAFRFIWVYPLIGVLLWEYRQPKETLGSNYRRIYLIGSIVWLLGSLWSLESMTYCTATWMPAYVWMILRQAYFQYWYDRKKNLTGFLRFSIGWGLLPAALLLMAVLGTSGIYKIWLGHLPDWPAYIEYAISFSSGSVGPTPVDPIGPVWVIVLGFGIISTGLVFFLRRGFTQPAIGLLLGLFGALWATSSYFVPRSNLNFILTLTPILCVVVAISIYLISRYHKNNPWGLFPRLISVPLFTMLLVSTFGNQPAFVTLFTSPQGSYAQIDERIGNIDKDLQTLFMTANVKSTDPIVYWDLAVGMMLPRWQAADKANGDLLSTSRLWLPLSSYALYIPLSKNRIREYMTRFTQRAKMSGWLIQRKSDVNRSIWLTDYLKTDFIQTKTFSQGNWTMTWFQYK